MCDGCPEELFELLDKCCQVISLPVYSLYTVSEGDLSKEALTSPRLTTMWAGQYFL